MKQILKIPKVRIILLLFLLFLVVIPQLSLPITLFLLVLNVGATVGSDLVFTYLRRKKLFIPYAAIVTGFILTLICDPSAAWYQLVAIGMAAMAVKNFLRIGNRHIFNPVASGLFVGWILFRLGPGWWGPTLYSGNQMIFLNGLLFIIILGVAYVSCWQLKRYYTVGSYLLILTLVTLLFSAFSFKALSATIFSPGVLFYAFLMLAEPMTSPVNKKRQIMYGILIAVIQGFLVYVPAIKTFGSMFFDASLTALLLGNLAFFKFR